MYAFLFLSSFCISVTLIYFLFKNYTQKEALIIVSLSFFVIISLVAGVVALNPPSNASETESQQRAAAIYIPRIGPHVDKPTVVQSSYNWIKVSKNEVVIDDAIMKQMDKKKHLWALNAIVKNNTDKIIGDIKIQIAFQNCRMSSLMNKRCKDSQTRSLKNVHGINIAPHGKANISGNFEITPPKQNYRFDYKITNMNVRENLPTLVDTTPTCGDCGHSQKVSYNNNNSCEDLVLKWPVLGRVIQKFSNGGDGINIAVPEGTQVKAVQSGEVAYAGAEIAGYGNMVIIKHEYGYVTTYAHNQEMLVKKGEHVEADQVIAKSGQSGNVSSPQIHFEIRKESIPIDPMGCLSQRA